MEKNEKIVTAKAENKITNSSMENEKSSKRGEREEKRKKDDKSMEQVLKALNSLETTEEKLAAMCKKYADIIDENRKLQLSLKQSEKRNFVLQREKEQLQTEHSKAVLTRSRLESLCRELQRQNKAVKDESLLKIREEEEKRKEVSAKFQSTLADVTSLMQQNNEKNTKLHEDNLEMTKKFKSVCEQYELREQQVEKISKQLQLESQLADARLTKTKMEMAAEKEVLLREKQQLLLEVTECQAKIKDLQITEANLRSQISLYTSKYDEFQNALSRSNEIFEGFKGEMEKMSKKICKLEKETSSWKQRWEKSHQALLEMAADKQQRDSDLALATKQRNQLQKLCRTLQMERSSLLAQLKAIDKPAIGSGDAEEHSKTVTSKQNKTVENSKDTIECNDVSSEASCEILKEISNAASNEVPNNSMEQKEAKNSNNAIEQKATNSNIVIEQEVANSNKIVDQEKAINSIYHREDEEEKKINLNNLPEQKIVTSSSTEQEIAANIPVEVTTIISPGQEVASEAVEQKAINLNNPTEEEITINLNGSIQEVSTNTDNVIEQDAATDSATSKVIGTPGSASLEENVHKE